MYIQDALGVADLLRPKLREYLTLKLNLDKNAKSFKCFVHKDNNPSMSFNPKNGETTAHCFSCGVTVDIFNACNILENMPQTGSEWITEMIPHLADMLDIPVILGTPGPDDKERLVLHKLASDITTVLEANPTHPYIAERNWSNVDLVIGSVEEDKLVAELMERGWSAQQINTSLMVRTNHFNFFGKQKVTFAIKDYRGRTVGFVSRNIVDKPKYINTPETLIYDKSRVLLGLDTATKAAKTLGLVIVEGPGDLAQLRRVGVINSIATCGTALTGEHLNTIKMLGIRRIYLAMDWDTAGRDATQRIIRDELKKAPGINCFVVRKPEGEAKDMDELLHQSEDAELFNLLKPVPAFEWMLELISDNADPATVCQELIPAIASEGTAIRRELLIKTLSQHTGISFQSILADVDHILYQKTNQRHDMLKAATEKFRMSVEDDPENVVALMSHYQDDINRIEQENNKRTIGTVYQLDRWDALQEKLEGEETPTEFKTKWFTGFGEALLGGLPLTQALAYFGGRPNSGKTAVTTGIGTDIALSDEDASTIFHTTDDSYGEIIPRILAHVVRMIREPGEPMLSIGMCNNPYYIKNQDQRDLYMRAKSVLRALIAEEKIVVVDAEDGSTLSTLTRNIKHFRARHPTRKLVVIGDNTHNYTDYPTLDQTRRMSMISTDQKNIAVKHHAFMIATVEYRKNMPIDPSKMKLPVDDDIADARALMYRPNLLVHVYNDLHDRKDHAEIMWEDGDAVKPRLILIPSKNKISPFKYPEHKWVLDLDPYSLSYHETSESQAKLEQIRMSNRQAEQELEDEIDADEF